MSEENKVTEEKELIKPFTIDHDAIMQNQQNAMIPSGNDNENGESVADQLHIPNAKHENTNDNTKSKPNKKQKNQEKEEESKDSKSGLRRMFDILPEGAANPNKKMYLVLLYINSNTDNVEDEKDFFFEVGRQAVYSRIRDMLVDGVDIDCMKSLIFVDSPMITISARTTVYSFMKTVREQNKVIDETSFDIEDYYYDIEDSESEEKY